MTRRGWTTFTRGITRIILVSWKARLERSQWRSSRSRRKEFSHGSTRTSS
uniref:Uncharacterized protein n=1 Tax=Aegilops tauschii subsp. strangulata TaxID=200361 RepID=A0A453HAQ8_AEGTS